MLIVRSTATGTILGFARDMEIATQMAQANDWKGWFVEEERPLPELQLVPRPPDTDPRNSRGELVRRVLG